MNSRYIFSTIATLTLAPCLAFAALHSSGGTASFSAVGPAGMEIRGKTSDLSVSEGNQKLAIRVGLSNLDTGISLRNRHMREKYLEVPKYPTAELIVRRSDLKFPEEGKELKASATGELTIHGRTRAVPFDYHAKRAGNAFDVTGSTRIDIRDYGIAVPSYLGLSVKPNVGITVSFVAKDD